MFFKRKNQKTINVEDLTKEGTSRLKTTLENLIDIDKAKINLNKKEVIITYNNTIDEVLIKNTIEKLGYIVTGIKG